MSLEQSALQSLFEDVVNDHIFAMILARLQWDHESERQNIILGLRTKDFDTVVLNYFQRASFTLEVFLKSLDDKPLLKEKLTPHFLEGINLFIEHGRVDGRVERERPCLLAAISDYAMTMASMGPDIGYGILAADVASMSSGKHPLVYSMLKKEVVAEGYQESDLVPHLYYPSLGKADQMVH